MEGLCLSKDRDRLARSIARLVMDKADEVYNALKIQSKSFKSAYKNHLQYKADLEKESEER